MSQGRKCNPYMFQIWLAPFPLADSRRANLKTKKFFAAMHHYKKQLDRWASLFPFAQTRLLPSTLSSPQHFPWRSSNPTEKQSSEMSPCLPPLSYRVCWRSLFLGLLHKPFSGSLLWIPPLSLLSLSLLLPPKSFSVSFFTSLWPFPPSPLSPFLCPSHPWPLSIPPFPCTSPAIHSGDFQVLEHRPIQSYSEPLVSTVAAFSTPSKPVCKQSWLFPCFSLLCFFSSVFYFVCFHLGCNQGSGVHCLSFKLPLF